MIWNEIAISVCGNDSEIDVPDDTNWILVDCNLKIFSFVFEDNDILGDVLNYDSELGVGSDITFSSFFIRWCDILHLKGGLISWIKAS
jgi:hypothetical protein